MFGELADGLVESCTWPLDLYEIGTGKILTRGEMVIRCHGLRGWCGSTKAERHLFAK